MFMAGLYSAFCTLKRLLSKIIYMGEVKINTSDRLMSPDFLYVDNTHA
jgi:hypothetical protein